MSKIKAQKDLITNLKSTDEYKRSKAIAGCITFLSEKIKELEFEKSNLIIKLDDLTKKNITQKELNSKLKSELEVQKSQNGLYKTKLTVLEELKKTFEQTVSELKNKLEKEKNDQKQRNEQYELAINKYKTTLYEIKNENKKYKKSDEVNKKLKNKIKKYEVLLYKMDLENQGYKDEIQKYQNQLSTITGQNINFIPIYKIDLNSELETIDKNKNKSENEIINDTNNTEENILTTNNDIENNEENDITNTNENNDENEINGDIDSKEENEDNNLKNNNESEDDNNNINEDDNTFEKGEEYVQTQEQDNSEDK